MKKFMLFGFYYYYPSGGLNDYIADFNDIEELHFIDFYLDYDEYQLFDVHNMKVVSKLKMDDIKEKMYEEEIYDYEEQQQYKRKAIFNWLKNIDNEQRYNFIEEEEGLKLYLCSSYTPYGEISDVVAASSESEAKEEYKKILDEKEELYGSIWVKEIKIDGYKIRLNKKGKII